ncbi:MAG: choice-of-anchor D domain-containing protein [Candidatus Neomarinimicrobiota bacterium]
MMFRKYLYIGISVLIFFIACEDKKGPSFEIIFDPVEYEFGKIEINKRLSQRIKIKNTDNSSEAFVGQIKLMDSPAFKMDFSGVLTLQKNESKEIYVTFLPTAAQEYSARLTVTNDNDDFFEMYVRGEGVAPVSFTYDKTKLEFGLIQPGDSKDLEVNFLNNASSGFDLELALSIPSSDFTILGNVSTLTIPPGQSETITVRYTPTVSTSSKSLKIVHNSSVINSPSQIPLTGTMDISVEIISNISKGWNQFESGNYSESLNSFAEAMNQARISSVYDTIYDKAMHGVGWSLLFNRGTNDYALAAYNNFFNCVNNNLLPMNTYYDVLAGLSISGVLALEKTSATLIISAANNVLSEYPNYEFTHKKSVNYKHVRMSKIQAHYYIGQYVNAASEMDILDPNNAPHSNDPIELLNAIQNLSGSL